MQLLPRVINHTKLYNSTDQRVVLHKWKLVEIYRYAMQSSLVLLGENKSSVKKIKIIQEKCEIYLGQSFFFFVLFILYK